MNNNVNCYLDMNKYEREFIRYLKIKEIEEGRKIIQQGGAIEKIRIGLHNIEYDLQINNSYTGPSHVIDLMAISTSRADDKKPCFIMRITPGSTSVLISISRGINCFIDKVDDSAGIVLAALEIAKLKGAKTFEFTDNSTKTVDGVKFKLSDLSFLTTGKTWYERILPGIKVYDEFERLDVEDSRRTVLTNPWTKVNNNLYQKGINIEFDTVGIDCDKGGSAKEVLTRAKNSRKYSAFFQENMGALVKSSGISSLHGINWVVDI
jgi:hypothetical protein